MPRHAYKKTISKAVLLQYTGMNMRDTAIAIAGTAAGSKCTYKRVWYAVHKHKLRHLFPSLSQAMTISRHGYA